ncbi:MAG: polysaccharide biosynthesis/export family protein [Gammaproteobacteria bacterium]|nr:MAG: polysaccharide biosynthesis/export family protein [Gammaproteobacteria bacterium]
MRKTTLALILSLGAGCAAPPPEPSPETLGEERQAVQASAARVVATRRTVDEQLEELHRVLSEFPSEFALGNGDVLSVVVYDEPDLTLEAVPIRPDGKISAPLIGEVQAAGRSTSALNSEITSRLEEFLVQPKVSVIALEFNSFEYTIDGEVVEPGVYPLSTEVSITKAIAKAGGLSKGQYRASTIELADLTHAYVAREGRVLPVDFVRLFREGDLRFDIDLRPGDYIQIPSGLSKEIYVLGEVREPMLFAYRENLPMSRTVAQAEGFTPDADLSRIHIIRGALHNPTVIVCDFRKVIAGEALDVKLEPGDIVYVPETGLTSWSRVMDKILPTMQSIWTGFLVHDALND